MDALPLIAYHRGRRPEMAIVPAGRWRDWMNDTVLRYANRCLPLLVANESGWWLLNERAFTATWNGDDHASGVTVDYGEAQPPKGRAVSIFGYGVLSFEIPWLFRTPPEWSLVVRGPANWPRDGIAPLEGIVETDWSVATFTMNWKFTRPGTVTFDADEPFCMVVPQERRELERFEPAVRPVEADPSTEAGWEAFRRGRHEISVRKFLPSTSRGWRRRATAGSRTTSAGTAPTAPLPRITSRGGAFARSTVCRALRARDAPDASARALQRRDGHRRRLRTYGRHPGSSRHADRTRDP